MPDTIKCHANSCSEAGEFRAPKSPQQLHDYVFFCKEHIRQYNQSWNYFKQATPEEIDQFERDALHGHRPTFSRNSSTHHHNAEELYRAFEHLYGEPIARDTATKPEEQAAMEALELSYPLDWEKIRKQYKFMVKEHHPDTKKSDCEEAIKKINKAYEYLKKIYKT